jgi:hypothetical protein
MNGLPGEWIDLVFKLVAAAFFAWMAWVVYPVAPIMAVFPGALAAVCVHMALDRGE